MDRTIGRLARPFALSGRSLLAAVLLSSAAFSCSSRSSLSGATAPSPIPPGPTPTPPDQAGFGSVDVALNVEEYAGSDRHAEPVRSGVPIPRGVALTDPSTLVVVDPTGAIIPSQIAVTSRWEGAPDDASKPIKWVLVDFQASVPAGGAAVYRLRTVTSPSPTTGSLIAADAADHISVDTGAARFTVSKSHFNLFDQVTLANGQTLLPSDPTGGAFLVDRSGNRFLAANGATDVHVEEDGPLHAVIVAHGKHVGTAGTLLDYTVRLHFWKGEADSLVSYGFTEKDLGSIYSYDPLSEVGLALPLSVGQSPSYAFGGEQSDSSGALNAEAWQHQTGNLDEAMGTNFNPGDASTIVWSNGGDAAGSGGHAPGWMDVTGASGGVTAALRWYWQLYPKKLDATPTRMTIDLWPKEDVGLRVYAASQKTHEVLFSFHDGQTRGTDAGHRLAARLAEPLFARCNPTWYARTWVWNKLGVADPAAYPPEHQAAVSQYFDYIENVQFPATFSDRRFNAAGRGHEYSMWDFGDAREDSWSNAAYDTPRSLMIFWAITGKRDFLDKAFEVTQYLRDVGIEHSPQETRTGITDDGGIPQPWLGRTRYNPTRGLQSHDLGYPGATAFGFEHSKGQGFADHYFLTGDRESRDVLVETYQYYNQWKRFADSLYLRTDGTRVVSHMLLILMGYYDAFGTPEARQRIDYAVQFLNDWQRATAPPIDPNGWMWIDDRQTTASWMNGVTGESLMLYEVDFPDGIPVRQNIIDAARFTVDPSKGILVYGAQGPYMNAWSWDNYGVPHASVLDPMSLAFIQYAGDALGDSSYTTLTKSLLYDYITEQIDSPLMKSYTQQTRTMPAYLWFLQTPDQRQEGATTGIAPVASN